jgi:hypothetical protein
MEVLRKSTKLLSAHKRVIWLYFLHIMDLQVYPVSVCQKKKISSAIWIICQYYLKENFWAGLGSTLDDIRGKDWVFGGGDHGDPGNFTSFRLIFGVIEGWMVAFSL